MAQTVEIPKKKYEEMKEQLEFLVDLLQDEEALEGIYWKVARI